MQISVIIPACNEEKYIEKCLNSIEEASHTFSVETIVVINRCKDDTKNIVENFWAKIVMDESENISKVRNAWIKQATWEIIITIDADSIMSENLIKEVIESMDSNDCIGGGVNIIPERTSAGIFCTGVFVKTLLSLMWISVWSFWTKKEYFDEINGFDENLYIAEDIDFARRLKKHWNKINKKYKNLKSAHIVTSCRKFDKFWDWHWFTFMFSNTMEIIRGFKKDKSFAKKYFFDFEK